MKAGLKRWRVMMNGTNFLISIDEQVRKVGFYTMVFVVARNAREAELKAVDCLRHDRKLRRAVRNTAADPPVLRAEEIEEIPSFRGCRRPRTGLGFYFEAQPKRKPRRAARP
jgi:hypothetical protein